MGEVAGKAGGLPRRRIDGEGLPERGVGNELRDIPKGEAPGGRRPNREPFEDASELRPHPKRVPSPVEGQGVPQLIRPQPGSIAEDISKRHGQPCHRDLRHHRVVASASRLHILNRDADVVDCPVEDSDIAKVEIGKKAIEGAAEAAGGAAERRLRGAGPPLVALLLTDPATAQRVVAASGAVINSDQNLIEPEGIADSDVGQSNGWNQPLGSSQAVPLLGAGLASRWCGYGSWVTLKQSSRDAPRRCAKDVVA